MLPFEIWLRVFHSLGEDFVNMFATLCKVSKGFKDAARDPSLWKTLWIGGSNFSPSLLSHVERCTMLGELCMEGMIVYIRWHLQSKVIFLL